MWRTPSGQQTKKPGAATAGTCKRTDLAEGGIKDSFTEKADGRYEIVDGNSQRVSKPNPTAWTVSRKNEPSLLKRAVTNTLALSILVFIISPYRKSCVSSQNRSEEHTSESSHMSISYAVFC